MRTLAKNPKISRKFLRVFTMNSYDGIGGSESKTAFLDT